MSFCDLIFKRKNDNIEVKNNKGEKSSLFTSILQYTSTNDVYTGREWFFDRLVEQGKLKSTSPSELALGLYSIAFNSGKSESYWLNKIDQLLPTKSNVVDYKIKAVDILQSDKAYQMFQKGKKNNWSLDKILSELMIPKDQKELIKEVQSEMSYYDEIPFNEQLAIEVASKYSFSVEIDVTKHKYDYNASDPDYDEEGNIISQGDNTSYYSYLTVPGGTNYTENEISTPLITPSIKGHAQFSTDNGIGWFRSDETLDLKIPDNLQKAQDKIEGFELNGISYLHSPNSGDETYSSSKDDFYYHSKNITKEEFEESLNLYLKNIDKPLPRNQSKTRRILEVQSDLFQKGRDKENLIIKEKSKYNAISENNEPIHPLLNNDELEDFSANEFPYKLPTDEIIGTRDFGYGEVREDENNFYFESGDGKYSQISKEKYEQEKIKLSKLDSAQLLESRDKGKQLNENKFLQLLNKDNNWVTFFVKSIIQDSFKKGYEKVLFPSGNTASKVEGHSTLEEFKKQKEDRIKVLEQDIKNFDPINDNPDAPKYNQEEINQLKQELENVEREGFGALKPIWNFYENTVTNILNNLYKNRVTRITDEYGNTWNEVSLYESNNYSNPLVIDRSVVINNNAKQSLLQPSDLKEEMINNWNDYYEGYNDLSNEEKIQFIELVESGLLEIQCKI